MGNKFCVKTHSERPQIIDSSTDLVEFILFTNIWIENQFTARIEFKMPSDIKRGQKEELSEILSQKSNSEMITQRTHIAKFVRIFAEMYFFVSSNIEEKVKLPICLIYPYKCSWTFESFEMCSCWWPTLWLLVL